MWDLHKVLWCEYSRNDRTNLSQISLIGKYTKVHLDRFVTLFYAVSFIFFSSLFFLVEDSDVVIRDAWPCYQYSLWPDRRPRSWDAVMHAARARKKCICHIALSSRLANKTCVDVEMTIIVEGPRTSNYLSGEPINSTTRDAEVNLVCLQVLRHFIKKVSSIKKEKKITQMFLRCQLLPFDSWIVQRFQGLSLSIYMLTLGQITSCCSVIKNIKKFYTIIIL